MPTTIRRPIAGLSNATPGDFLDVYVHRLLRHQIRRRNGYLCHQPAEISERLTLAIAVADYNPECSNGPWPKPTCAGKGREGACHL